MPLPDETLILREGFEGCALAPTKTLSVFRIRAPAPRPYEDPMFSHRYAVHREPVLVQRRKVRRGFAAPRGRLRFERK